MSAIKKLHKKTRKFLKKHWVKILLVAATVLTAGVATVGFAGFSSAMAAAGGGVGGFLSAAGSTFVAGAAAIGGSLGIGSGVTASTAGGAFAAAPVMQGVAAGTGLTLGSGAAAQSLGLAASTSAPAAALGGGPPAALAGPAGSTAITQGGRTAVNLAAGAGGAGGAANAASTAAGTMGSGGGSGTIGSWIGNNAGTLIQTGMGLVNGYMQGRQQEEDWERTKPRGFFGVGLNDEESVPIGGEMPLMWSPQSFQRPPQGYTGNAAVDAGRQADPYANSPLNPNYDPTARRLGAFARG